MNLSRNSMRISLRARFATLMTCNTIPLIWRVFGRSQSTSLLGQFQILVSSIWCVNRATFIQGGSRRIRLPPFQQHNVGEAGYQEQWRFTSGIWPQPCCPGISWQNKWPSGRPNRCYKSLIPISVANCTYLLQ